MALLWSQPGAGGLGLVAQLCHPQLRFPSPGPRGMLSPLHHPLYSQQEIKDTWKTVCFILFHETASQYFFSHLTSQNLLHDPILGNMRNEASGWEARCPAEFYSSIFKGRKESMDTAGHQLPLPQDGLGGALTAGQQSFYKQETCPSVFI